MPTLDPAKGIMGVYDEPPAEGSGIQGVPLYSEGGVIELALIGARRLTRLRDRLGSELEELLGL